MFWFVPMHRHLRGCKGYAAFVKAWQNFTTWKRFLGSCAYPYTVRQHNMLLCELLLCSGATPPVSLSRNARGAYLRKRACKRASRHALLDHHYRAAVISLRSNITCRGQIPLRSNTTPSRTRFHDTCGCECNKIASSPKRDLCRAHTLF